MADFKSSDDVLAAINQATSALPEGVPEAEDESYGWGSEERVEPTPQPAQYSEPEVYDPNEELADYIEDDHNSREQWKTEETQRLKDEYSRTGIIPQYRSFEEWQTHKEIVQPQQDLQKALSEDIEDLITRYPKSSASFLKKMRRGEIVIPEDIETVDNALEYLFQNSMTDNEFRRMDQETQVEFINGASTKPLRTRSLDVALPARKKPAKQPVRREPTYTLPDVTQQDFQEMFSDWMRKHPEKIGRRR